jgi:hypothetical protein
MAQEDQLDGYGRTLHKEQWLAMTYSLENDVHEHSCYATALMTRFNCDVIRVP